MKLVIICIFVYQSHFVKYCNRVFSQNIFTKVSSRVSLCSAARGKYCTGAVYGKDASGQFFFLQNISFKQNCNSLHVILFHRDRFLLAIT